MPVFVLMATAFIVVMVFAAATTMFAATAVTAAALMRKLRINHQRGKQHSTGVIEYAQRPMPMALIRNMREH